MALTQQDQQFKWTTATQEAFEELQSCLIQAPLLILPDFEKPSVVETDATDIATWGILLQYGEDGHLHLCAYPSSKISLVEKNYDIYNKEFLDIVLAFRDWQVYLEKLPYQVKVITDHKNLKKFVNY